MSPQQYDVVVLGAGLVGCYLAFRVVKAGKTVALVDRGPDTIRKQQPAQPTVQCPEREHQGARKARNHLLGGNSHYWGGGLIRATGSLTTEIAFGPDHESLGTDEALHRLYATVEEDLHVPHEYMARAPASPIDDSSDFCRASLLMLMGNERNIATKLLRYIAASGRATVISKGELEDIDLVRGVLRSFRVRGANSELLLLRATNFVITTGSIDSILFAMRFAEKLAVECVERLGTGLHDHLSVPIFEVTSATPAFLAEVAPVFQGRFLLLRRFECQSERTWNASGYLHFQFLFDQVSPYRELKELMTVRQQRQGMMSALRLLGGVASGARLFARLALDRVLARRMAIDERVPIIGTVDFESYPSRMNRLELAHVAGVGTKVLLHWTISEQDVESFADMHKRCSRLMNRLKERGIVEFADRVEQTAHALADYLERNAVDAYHLGGGIPVGKSVAESVLDPELRFHRVPNLLVLSAAVFSRPGPVNPTHTLLALAARIARRLS